MNRESSRKKPRSAWRMILSLFACVLLWLAALTVPGLYGRAFPEAEPNIDGIAQEESLVVLYAAEVPKTRIADHGWFAIREQGGWERWEVWQRAGGPYEHVRHDLLPPHQDVGAGGRRIIAFWQGETARALGTCLAEKSPRYRHRHRYLIWPGPNSNTYIAAMLDACGVEQALPWSFYGAWMQHLF